MFISSELMKLSESIELNIEDTLQILYSMERLLKVKRKNKNDLSLELKRCIKYLIEKDFMLNINVTISFDSTTITLYGNSKLINEFMIFSPNTNKKIFAPIIYYMFPEIQCCGRMIVYKNTDRNITYLVHRSNFKDHPSEHPGGHIEFFEFGNDSIYSGKQYVELILQKMNIFSCEILSEQNNWLFDIKKHTLNNANIMKWVLYGTCREVNEEAGLDLSSFISNIDLIKLGTKTHYFSVMIDNNITESGPQEKFKSEVYTKKLSTKSINKSINKTYSKKGTLSLDEFWNLRKNSHTHHAWITSDEMKFYWNQKYRQHIDEIINIITQTI